MGSPTGGTAPPLWPLVTFYSRGWGIACQEQLQLQKEMGHKPILSSYFLARTFLLTNCMQCSFMARLGGF